MARVLMLAAVALVVGGAAPAPAAPAVGSEQACRTAADARTAAHNYSLRDMHAEAISAANHALALCPDTYLTQLTQLWVKVPALFRFAEDNRKPSIEGPLKAHYDRLLQLLPTARTNSLSATFVARYEAARLAAEVYPPALLANRTHGETHPEASLIDWLQEGWVASTPQNNAKPYRDRIAALRAAADKLDPKGDLRDRALKIAQDHARYPRPIDPASTSAASATKPAPNSGLFRLVLSPPAPAVGEDSVAAYKPLAEYLSSEIPGAAQSENPKAAIAMWLDGLWETSTISTAYGPYRAAVTAFYNRQPSADLKLAFEKAACSQAQLAEAAGKPVPAFLYNWISPPESGECVVGTGAWKAPPA